MALGAGISAGGSLLGGIFGSKGAEKAAKIQQQNAQQVAQMASTAANTAATGVTTAANTGATNIAGATANGQQQVAGAVSGANSTLQQYLQQQLQQYQPYSSAGTNSLAQLQQLTGANGPLSQQFTAPTVASLSDPNNPASAGYQFTLQQGQQALQRSAAAQGSLFSTGTQKSLAGYAAGTANQYYQQAYNDALSTFNTNRQGVLSQISGLQNLAGMGYGAAQGASSAIGQNAGLQSQNTVQGGEYGANLGLTGTTSAAGMNLAGAQSAGQFGLQGAQIAGQALTGGANAQAAGVQGSTNAWLSALGGGTNALSQYLTYQNNPYLFGGAGAVPYGSSTWGTTTQPLSPSGGLQSTPYTGGYENSNGQWVVTGGNP